MHTSEAGKLQSQNAFIDLIRSLEIQRIHALILYFSPPFCSVFLNSNFIFMQFSSLMEFWSDTVHFKLNTQFLVRVTINPTNLWATPCTLHISICVECRLCYLYCKIEILLARAVLLPSLMPLSSLSLKLQLVTTSVRYFDFDCKAVNGKNRRQSSFAIYKQVKKQKIVTFCRTKEKVRKWVIDS